MSTTRPSNLPEWATDGGADKTAPASTVQTAGFAFLDFVPVNIKNWFWNQCYEWLEYLDAFPRSVYIDCTKNPLIDLDSTSSGSQVPAEQTAAGLGASSIGSGNYADVYIPIDEYYQLTGTTHVFMSAEIIAITAATTGDNHIDWQLESVLKEQPFTTAVVDAGGALAVSTAALQTITSDTAMAADKTYRLRFRIYTDGVDKTNCRLIKVWPKIRSVHA